MYFKGEDFFYTFNGENKTKEEIEELIDYDTTVSIDGLNIDYFSAKKSKKTDEKLKIEELRNHILNNNTVDKEFTDIIRLITADSEEELIVLLNELCDSNKPDKIVSEKEAVCKNNIQEILKEADEHQAKNGGILRGVEFPFDYTGTIGIEEITDIITKEREQKVIEDWNRNEFYITPQSKENLDKMCDNFDKSMSRRLDILSGGYEKRGVFEKKENTTEGKKETENKVNYSEINFKLLDLMAKRFNDNKHKYPKGNTLKVINKDEILWAAFRHIRKMIQPIEDDPETYEDHLAAVATNMSIILDQIYGR